MHYVIDGSLIALACFGVVELAVFLAAVFIAPAEFDWDDDEVR